MTIEKDFTYRFLTEHDFADLHKTWLEAFSDYAVNMQCSEDELRKRFVNNRVELRRSVGVFDGEKMLGFTVNGFGDWQGSLTAYDSGTGIVPQYRGRGIAKKLFEFMLPRLSRQAVERYLLEVITTNEPAVNLYRRLGFEITRTLSAYEIADPPEKFSNEESSQISVRETEEIDWNLFQSFWDWQASWQNSIVALESSASKKIIFGAFDESKCVGYAAVFPVSGSLPHLAVARPFRRKGIGTSLLKAVQIRVGADKALKVVNLDCDHEATIRFYKAQGGKLMLNQFEMSKMIKETASSDYNASKAS